LISRENSRSISALPKFLANLLALLSSTASQVLIQLLTIPILLNSRGIDSAAIWLLAFNISQITTILDFGALSATQNSAFDLGKRKKHDQLNQNLSQLTLLLIIANSAFLAVIFFLNKFIGLRIDFSLVTIFVVSNLLQNLFSYFEIFTRVEDKTSWGIYASNFIRIFEFVAVISVLKFTSDSLYIAALMGLLVKFILICFLEAVLEQKYKFLRIDRFKSDIFYSNLKNGFPFFLNKIADIVVLNLPLVVIQDRMKSREIVLFIAARTFFRLGLQITAVLSHNFGYEMTKSWSLGDMNSMMISARRSRLATISLSALGVIVYWFFGDYLFGVWTNHKLSLSTTLLFVGICYSFFLSINLDQKTKFNSINLNFHTSWVQFALSVFYVCFLYLYSDTYSVLSLLSLSMIFEILSLVFTSLRMRGKIEEYFHHANSIFRSDLA